MVYFFPVLENRIICEIGPISLLATEGNMQIELQQLTRNNSQSFLRTPVIHSPQGWNSVIDYRYSPPIELVLEKRESIDNIIATGLVKSKVEEEL